MQDIFNISVYVYIRQFQVQHQQKKYKSITSSFSGRLTHVKKWRRVKGFTRSTSIHWLLRLYSIKMPRESPTWHDSTGDGVCWRKEVHSAKVHAAVKAKEPVTSHRANNGQQRHPGTPFTWKKCQWFRGTEFASWLQAVISLYRHNTLWINYAGEWNWAISANMFMFPSYIHCISCANSVHVTV